MNEEQREKQRLYMNARIKMILIDILSVILILTAILLSVRFVLNKVFQSQYDKGIYEYGTEKALTVLNINEGYVPYYNMGNVDYKNGDLHEAIANYNKALSYNIPSGKECDIRVNLALSMCYTIDFDDLEDEASRQNAINTLKAARNILTAQGCADPVGTAGHDEDAEQLKQDIDKMLEELGSEPDPPQENDDQSQDQNNSGNDDNQNKKSGQDQKEKDLKEELEKQQRESQEERRDAEQEKAREEESQGSGGGGNDGGSGGEQQGKKW